MNDFIQFSAAMLSTSALQEIKDHADRVVKNWPESSRDFNAKTSFTDLSRAIGEVLELQKEKDPMELTHLDGSPIKPIKGPKS